jgi:rubrerythrin
MELKGSQTETNLMCAFAGESQARNRYTYYSSVAKKEGYVQISAIFTETANQEKEHAKRLFKLMEGGEIEIPASTFPAGPAKDTKQNLLDAAAGEEHEWTDMYPSFEKTAKEEGFLKIAAVFAAIAVAEKFHDKRYKKLAANIEAGTVFESGDTVIWQCRNCGFLHESPKALNKCPACDHPQAHFEIISENW